MQPRRRSTSAFIVAALALALWAAAPAGAVVYETGSPIELLTGDCAPASGQAYYTKQNAPGSTVGINPKVGDVFYVGITVSFFQSFDCAADFWASAITLPPNVVPAVGDPSASGEGARPICIRRAFQGSQAVDDPRAAGNCPTSVGSSGTSLSFNPATRELRLGPKPGATFPDMSQASYWFIGQNAPAESLLYTRGVMLVPVKATAAMTDAPMTTQLCTVGTTCARGSTVGVDVDMAAAPAAVTISLGGDVQTSAESAVLPFSVTTNTPAYQLRVAVRDVGASTFACGATNYQYLDVADGGGTFEFRIGPEFDPVSSDGYCYLRPGVDHTFELCRVTNTTTKAVDTAGCRSLAFRTSLVGTDFRPPQETAEDRPDSTTMVVRDRRILTSHPNGDFRLQRKPAGAADTAYVNSAPTDAPESDAGGSDPDPLTWTGFAPWTVYDVRSCFFPLQHCAPSTRLVAGHVTAPADATAVTHDAATVSGLPSAPWPAGTLSIRTSTGDPGPGDPREVMAEAATVAVPARAETAAGAPIAVGLTGLAASTTYFWAACFDAPAATGIEDCSPVRSFTTAAAPGGGPDPGPGAPPPPGTTPPPAATPAPTPGPGPGGESATDTTKPKLSLRVKGKLRRGGRVTLTAVASDASGIAKVTIRVGRAKPVAKRSLKVRLPAHGKRVTVIVVAADRAGNAATLRKTLRLK